MRPEIPKDLIRVAVDTAIYAAEKKSKTDTITGLDNLAKALGVCSRTVFNYKEKGLIPYQQAVKGGRLIFSKAAVSEALIKITARDGAQTETLNG